jgi:hypothetical protein
MTKNIEALAKIGEKVILKGLNDSLNQVVISLTLREQSYGPDWKMDIRYNAEVYRKEKDRAVKLGLDVSSYEEEFSRVNKRYLEITGENLLVEGDKK